MFLHQNHATRGGNGSIMVGMFVCLCLASQKPSEREFFVPARTDLGVKLLIPLAARGLEEPRNSQELLTESVDLTKFVGPLPFSV